MAISRLTSGELKTRVVSCLNKLSDRDTLAMAAKELESIARGLSDDAFAPFLNCLSATDSSEKSPVRRQCVRLLSVLSAAHGDALSPHLPRMISTVLLRRLRDPESAVRAACVDAVSCVATHVNSPPFTVILKPLVDALFQEQDSNTQIGASLCLSAAVEAAPEPDAAQLRKLLPRILKLVRSKCFKAKAGVLLFIGSILSTGCPKSKILLNSVVLTAIEFLSSEDWAARKAAAEVLEKVAASERNLASEFKDCCVAALESRRFDKVKHVRETMNRALWMWKDLPGLSEDSSPPNDTSSSGQSPDLLSGSLESIAFKTPQPRKMALSRSVSSGCSSSTAASSQKSTITNEDSELILRRNFRSRVAPFNCNNDNSGTADEYYIADEFENRKEVEELSLIREQLRHIEKQQLDMLDLIQNFIESSHWGMSSLEKRVDGLEKALDEMSRDLTISTERMSGTDNSEHSCYLMPRAEFLSPKFRRKAEGQSINPRSSSYSTNPSLPGVSGKGAGAAEASKLDSPRN